MFSMGTLYAVVILAALLTELNAVAYAVPSKPSEPQHSLPQRLVSAGGEATAAEERKQVNSVTVNCHPDSMEILIQSDLFGVGWLVRSTDLRLGVDHDDRCEAISISNHEYRITAGLLECGTKHWMYRDSLVYTNLLIYSPEPPAGGVVRSEEAVIPIECQYDRKYSLSSAALAPTWIPFVSTLSPEKKLNFDLKIMTHDWLYKRGSNVFHLGDLINLETSVQLGHHIGLRVFLSSCVATLSPDEHSMPRYVFIEDGCLLDSQLPNSRSQFLSRVQDDKLHLILDAFRFHNNDRAELYISCQVTAVPIHDANSPNKACTFNNGRWISADGNDYLCGHCQSQNEEGHIKSKPGSHFRPRAFRGQGSNEHLWKRAEKSEPELQTRAKIGPLLVLEKKMEPKLDQSLYGSIWRSGLHPKTGLTSKFEPGDLIENELTEDMLENEVTKDIADKGLDSDQFLSPEEVTETEDDTSPEAADEDYDDTDKTLEETTDDFELGESLVTRVMEVQENETTPDSSDIHTTPVYNMNITISMNDSLYDTDAIDPKK